MKYTVVISERAKRQIAQHVSFLADVNKNAARKLKKNIIEDLNALSDMPRRYSYLNDELIEKNYYRKMLFEGRYLAVYHINGNTVYIDYVVDYRQDYQWLLK